MITGLTVTAQSLQTSANDVSHAQTASGALRHHITQRTLDTVGTGPARPGNEVKRIRNRRSSDWSESLHQMTSTLRRAVRRLIRSEVVAISEETRR